MGEPQNSYSSRSASDRRSEVELEWLVARLVDEAEYWELQARSFQRVVSELWAEVDALSRSAERTEATSRGVSSQPLGDVGSSGEPSSAPLIRGLALALPVGVLLWALVGLLGYAVYRLIAG